ncbi:MAG: SpoIIE family protein phosphatase [Candidatus Zixiibacteriota bacterium]
MRKLQLLVSELTSLNEIATAINSSMSVQEISSSIIDKCLTHTKAVQGAVYLIESNSAGDNKAKTFVRRNSGESGEIPFHLHMSLLGWMFKNKSLLTLNDPGSAHQLHRIDFAKLGIHSLMAAPLLSASGLIGVLAIFNKRAPEGFNTDDGRFLEILGTQCAQVLEKARLYTEERELTAIRKELAIARAIQSELLPSSDRMTDSTRIYGINVPAREVSGDYFDIIELSRNRTFLAIGDVVGKGIPAALLMSNGLAVLRSHIADTDEISLPILARKLNDLIYKHTHPSQFITSLFGIHDASLKTFKFINAGHPPPIIASNSGLQSAVTDGDLVLGVAEQVEYHELMVQLPDEAAMILYTDGLDEATDESGNQFGREGIENHMLVLRDGSAETICQKLVDTLQSYRGSSPQSDDITIVCIRT